MQFLIKFRLNILAKATKSAILKRLAKPANKRLKVGKPADKKSGVVTSAGLGLSYFLDLQIQCFLFGRDRIITL